MLHAGREPRLRVVLTGIALASLCLPPGLAHAAHDPSPAEVGRAIADRRSRVAEFQLIKEAAEELGMRVWLFGGTAAGFAHYVRWDLAREAGDARYRESFFDYDFTNIYRSTQDADLVVDATAEQAERLENLLKKKMSFLQGSKEHWEVRLLRYPRTAAGGQVKLPLLDNPDFLGQNTDSNSTGMIELTDPPRGEGEVRDLRNWESATPFFLQDVTQGRLHYYLSPTHRETSRFHSGDNPPLFSVIRYLVKAFQYDLAIEGDDRAKIQGIIDALDPQRAYRDLSPWARGWLERYGPNLIRHAVNIEYAWNTLEELGLRQKLISLSHPYQTQTLGWWLSREPLRTRPLGETGRTAAELGIEVVAHETSDFLAYESITRDTTMRPNVLVSRPDAPGENAGFGQGFYTLVGRRGGKGTGLTVRFRLDPRAREGSDFMVHQGMVLVTNRAALEVIPESLDASVVDYFRLLGAGLANDADRGVWMKLKRRVFIKPVRPGEAEQIREVVAEIIEAKGEATPIPLLSEWFARPEASSYPAILRSLIDHPRLDPERSGLVDSFLVREVLSKPEWSGHPELVHALIGRSVQLNQEILGSILTQPAWASHPELVEALLEDGRIMNSVAREILSREIWKDHPEFWQRLKARSDADRAGSLEARAFAYQELGYAVLSDPATSGRGVASVRLVQFSKPDGSFYYRPFLELEGFRRRDRISTLAEMTALQARRLAPVLAGLRSPPSQEPDMWALPGANGLGESEWRARAMARALLDRFPGPSRLGPAEEASVQAEVAALMRESEWRASDHLKERWAALERAVDALLRSESETLSAAQMEEILRSTPSPEHWSWDDLLQRMVHAEEGGRACR